jgi:hypothetical protein
MALTATEAESVFLDTGACQFRGRAGTLTDALAVRSSTKAWRKRYKPFFRHQRLHKIS